MPRGRSDFPSRSEILQAFANARHTVASRAVVDAVESGGIRVAFRRKLSKAGWARGNFVAIRRTKDFGGMLTTMVHEGQHCLDIQSGIFPAENPGGTICLLAEMIAWKEAARFAVLNGYTHTVAFRMANLAPRELAITIEKQYQKAIGSELSLDQVREVIRKFEERESEIQDA